MKELRSVRLLGLPIELAAVAVLVAAARADTASRVACPRGDRRTGCLPEHVRRRQARRPDHRRGPEQLRRGLVRAYGDGKKVEPVAPAPSTGGGYSYGGGR